MPIQSYSCDIPGAVYSGQWLDWVIPSGRAVRQWQGQNTQLDLVITGTELLMLCNYDAGQVTMQVSVDGGAFTPLAGNGGTWADVTVFSGLSDSPHAVTIKQTAGSTAWFYLDFNTAFTVSGAAPAIGAPPNAPAMIPLSGGRLLVEGGWNGQALAGYSNPPVSISSWMDAAVRLRAKCNALSVWMLLDGSKIKTQIDGVDGALLTADPPVWAAGTPVYGWLQIMSGLDNAVEHEYSFSLAYSPYGASAIHAVGLTGGEISGVAGRRPVRIAFYGDSVTYGTTGTGNDSSLGYVHRVGFFTGRHGPFEIWNRAIPGTTVKDSGAVRVSDLISAAPTQVVILYGTNDMTGVGGPETISEFQIAYSNMLAQIISGLTGAKIFCLGIMPRNDVAVDRQPWSAAIKAAVNGAGSKNLIFVPVEGWIDPATDTADGVHPNGSGYAKIAARLEGLLGYDAALNRMSAVIAGQQMREAGAIG